MTFYTGIAAVAAAGSAIIAWVARADSLRAQDSASEAQLRAGQIAEKSAEALDRANALTEKHFADRYAAERRRERAKWAALLRGWMMSKSLTATLPPGESFPATIRRVTFAEVSDARMALDEPSADRLQGSVSEAINKVADRVKNSNQDDRAANLHDMAVQLANSELLIEAWIADPAETSSALWKSNTEPAKK